MKTSFAETFYDFSSRQETIDRVFHDRVTIRNILDENDIPLSPEEIFVIKPYDKNYKSEKVATLLVNKELREEFENITEEIQTKKQALLKKLKALSGIKKESEIEELLATDISGMKDVFISLSRINSEVQDYLNTPMQFSSVKYASVFNDKSTELLSDPGFVDKINNYIQTYDNLLEKSNFFKRGVFTHNNAADVAKKLKENGFFKANHSVNLKIGNDELKISTEADLEKAIEHEKESIINDQQLKEAFERIDGILVKNQSNRDFREYIENNKEIIPELKEPRIFKQKLWIAYLAQNYLEYNALIETYNTNKERIREILEKAEMESTKWQAVIDEFNERYSVPFKLKMTNKAVSVLGQTTAPSVKFEFVDGKDQTQIEEQNLVNVLSQGERRALYILNIIFEVEARKESGQETLFTVDDIADSFDYKNKYAIVEYLKDISEIDRFKLIILSHNFDFFRTVITRLELTKSHYAAKYETGIKLEEPKYSYKNPFKELCKFDTTNRILASIPFVRNLAEFCINKEAEDKLTNLLHQTSETSKITMADLYKCFSTLVKGSASFGSSKSVESEIYNSAESILKGISETITLEDKIILSIAIRLKAEKYMITEINNDVFIESLRDKSNQTSKLIKEFKRIFPLKREAISVLNRVSIMTPENIHLNSFMFEPILDMSSDHLKKLYNDVQNLSQSEQKHRT